MTVRNALTLALGLALHTPEGGEAGGALGAARLAALATGASIDDVCRPPPVSRRFDPEPAQAAALAVRRARWQRLYPALRERFQDA